MIVYLLKYYWLMLFSLKSKLDFKVPDNNIRILCSDNKDIALFKNIDNSEVSNKELNRMLHNLGANKLESDTRYHGIGNYIHWQNTEGKKFKIFLPERKFFYLDGKRQGEMSIKVFSNRIVIFAGDRELVFTYMMKSDLLTALLKFYFLSSSEHMDIILQLAGEGNYFTGSVCYGVLEGNVQ